MSGYAGKSIWLIGASSGIGHALALELDRRGARLVLSARDGAKLEQLNGQMGSRHTVVSCDVTDAASVMQAAVAVKTLFPRIDSVIFMAGAYRQMDLANLDMEAARQIVQTNLIGALHVIDAVLPHLLAQKTGQFALCASVAGYRGLPHAQPYGATKAALINLAESLRAETSHKGLDIRVINPGFVRTPMTDQNTFPMPMMIEPEQAATAIADGLLGDNFEIHFPKRFTWAMKLLKHLPNFIYFRIMPR